jgi:hypothetical protein
MKSRNSKRAGYILGVRERTDKLVRELVLDQTLGRHGYDRAKAEEDGRTPGSAASSCCAPTQTSAHSRPCFCYKQLTMVEQVSAHRPPGRRNLIPISTDHRKCSAKPRFRPDSRVHSMT